MLMEGRITLRAPIQKVWEAILEPSTLLSCIPGAESIEKVDDKTYECLVRQKVGPISTRFKFRNVIKKMEPQIEGDEEDLGKAGHFVQRSVVDLKEISKGHLSRMLCMSIINPGSGFISLLFFISCFLVDYSRSCHLLFGLFKFAL